MAILDGIKNAVTANVARSANKVAVNGLNNIVGDIFGTNPLTGPAAQLAQRQQSKFCTKNLAYPAGVEGDDQQGHYIIFEILEQNKAKLKSSKGENKIAELKKEVDKDYGDTEAGAAQRQKAIDNLEREKERVERVRGDGFAPANHVRNASEFSAERTTHAKMVAGKQRV